MLLKIIVYIFLLIHSALSGILIVTPNEIDISTLKPFDWQTYHLLKNTYNNANIITFNLKSEQIPKDCERFVRNTFTSYLTNVDYMPEDYIELKHSESQNCDFIKNHLNENNVYLIVHTTAVKRSLRETSIDVSASTDATTVSLRDRPIAKDKTNPKNSSVLYDGNIMMVYSSRLLHFQYLNISEYFLGNATLITINSRDTIYKLSCTIALDDGKIIIIFLFRWESGYWNLSTIEIWDAKGGNSTLVTNSQISAPRGFSYRCGGETVFSNGNYTLTLYDMQVQPQTKGGRFSDAYNCVPFITGPIWSGIFVTSILCVALLSGLTALGSIKTMDKFDNSKTKQLTITVIGE